MDTLVAKENKTECLGKLEKVKDYSFTRLARTFVLRRTMSMKLTSSTFAPNGRPFGFSFEGTITETKNGSVIEGKSKALARTWLAYGVVALAAIIAIALWFEFKPPFQNIFFEIALHASVVAAFFLNIFIRLRLFDDKVRKDLADAFNSKWEK